MAIGFFVGGAIHAQAYARARADIPDYLPVPPEVRLRAMTVGAIVIPIGLFGFAWTATSNVHWVVCIIFSVIFGTGYIILFASGLLYLLDAYNMFAASAVAANGMLRFLFGAAFPLFAFFLFDNLGVHWAVTRMPFPFATFRVTNPVLSSGVPVSRFRPHPISVLSLRALPSPEVEIHPNEQFSNRTRSRCCFDTCPEYHHQNSDLPI